MGVSLFSDVWRDQNPNDAIGRNTEREKIPKTTDATVRFSLKSKEFWLGPLGHGSSENCSVGLRGQLLNPVIQRLVAEVHQILQNVINSDQ